MRTLKKTLCLVLCLAMMVGLCAIGAVAADYSDADEIKYTTAVDVLSAIKVLQGDERGFRPGDGLTRAEGCTIIAKLVGQGSYSGKSGFTDCAGHWGDGAIAYCYAKGIVNGYGDGTFGPNDPLTGYAFAKMLLCALGYDQNMEGMTGASWEVGVATLAKLVGLADAIPALSGGEITREEAAQLGLTTLTLNMVEYVGGMSITTGDGTKVEQKVPAAPVTYSTATPNDYRSNGTAKGGAADGVQQFCELYFPTLKYQYTGAVNDYGESIGKWFLASSAGDYVVTDAKVITEQPKTAAMATYDTGIAKVTYGKIYTDGGMVAATTLNVIENGEANGTFTPASKTDTTNFGGAYAGATAKLEDTDFDGIANQVVVEYGYLAVVTKVVDATATAKRSIQMTVFNSNTVAGVSYTTDDFALGDFVVVYPSGKIATTDAFATANAFSGKIIEVKAAESFSSKASSVTGTAGAYTAVTAGGTTYPIAAAVFSKMGVSATVAATNYVFTSEYTFYTSNGYLIGVAGKTAAASADNIVYIAGAAFPATNEYNETINKVRAVALDGTISDLVNLNGLNDTAANPIAAGFYTKTAAAGGYRFTPVGLPTAINNTTVYFGATTLSAALSMNSKTTTAALTSGTKGYVTDTTGIMFASMTGGLQSTLKVTTATGKVTQDFAAGCKVLVSKDRSNNYVIMSIVSTAAQVDVNGEVVFFFNQPTGKDAVGNLYGIYKIEADAKSTNVPVTNDNAASTGFATYTTTSKGAYKFTNVDAAGANNGNGTYATTGAIGLYNNLVSAECGTYDVIDLDASAAVIIRADGKSAALTLNELNKAAALTAQIFVKDKKVVAIAVTAYTAP